MKRRYRDSVSKKADQTTPCFSVTPEQAALMKRLSDLINRPDLDALYAYLEEIIEGRSEPEG